MNNIFDDQNIQKLGRTLVRIAALMPEFIVTKTPFMVIVFKLLSKLANTAGKMEKEHKQNMKLANRLNYHSAQYDTPGVTWMPRGQYRVPLILATWEQKVQYNQERRPAQVLPEIIAQIEHAFQGGDIASCKLPKNDLVLWLRQTLLNTPAHWYVTTTDSDADSPIGIALDFSTFCNEVEHESIDCKYNIRDIEITTTNQVIINQKTQRSSVEHLSMSEQDEDQRPLRHSTFLTLTLLQQACQATYHNWIHFYFNDFVLLFVESHVAKEHWIKQLLNPHMRYQTVLNNAGLFSRVPNDILSNEVYDDILFGANLSSWSLDTFQKNIADKGLGYYVKAEHSSACDETNRLNFNLNKAVDHPIGQMKILVNQLEQYIHQFVSTVIDHCASQEDQKLMGLINDNILKFMAPDCLAGIKPQDDNPKGRFKLIISRYILQAGIVHGLEHYTMYFWLAPLNLPQRIRQFFNPNLNLDDYSYDIDKSNGYFGHRMFTKYAPNKDNSYNWSTLDYGFRDPSLKQEAQTFVVNIQRLIEQYDQDCLEPARKILAAHHIPIDQHCYLTPRLIGTSICM